MLFDPVYWIIIGVAIGLSLLAAARVKLAYRRGREVPVESGYTGAQVAKAILRHHDVDGVEVVEHRGLLSDHYNPVTRTLALSREVYHGRSAAAAGIAAHEVGHAIQHAHGYFPMHVRSWLVPVAGIGDSLGPWVIIAGILLGAGAGAGFGYQVAVAGVILMGAATAFTLVTIPVEYDASARAKRILDDMGLIRAGEERATVDKVLNAAGLTYLAAAVSSILFLLYWAAQIGLLGGND